MFRKNKINLKWCKYLFNFWIFLFLWNIFYQRKILSCRCMYTWMFWYHQIYATSKSKMYRHISYILFTFVYFGLITLARCFCFMCIIIKLLTIKPFAGRRNCETKTTKEKEKSNVRQWLTDPIHKCYCLWGKGWKRGWNRKSYHAARVSITKNHNGTEEVLL